MQDDSAEDYVDATSGKSYIEIENQIKKKKNSIYGLLLLYISLAIISIVVV